MVSIEGLAAGCCIFLGLCGAGFFTMQWRNGKASWEYIFYMCILVIHSLFQILYSEDHKSPIYVHWGTHVNMLRQIFFIVQTPIQMKLLWDVLNCYGIPLVTDETLMQLLITNQTMLVFGWAALWFTPMSVSFFINCLLAWICCGGNFFVVNKAGKDLLAALKTPEEKALLNTILILFYGVQVVIGILFMIEPSCFGIVSLDISNALHELSYLVAKPAHAYLCWKFVYVLNHGPNVHLSPSDKEKKHKHKDDHGSHAHTNDHHALVGVATKIFIVDVDRVAINIFQQVIVNQLKANLTPVETSEMLFEYLGANPNSIVLISYALMQTNTDTLVQGIEFVGKGSTKIVIYGGMQPHEQVPYKYRQGHQAIVLENIFNQELIFMGLERAVHQITHASNHKKHSIDISNDPDQSEIYELVKELELEMSELIGKQASKSTGFF